MTTNSNGEYLYNRKIILDDFTDVIIFKGKGKRIVMKQCGYFHIVVVK